MLSSCSLGWPCPVEGTPGQGGRLCEALRCGSPGLWHRVGPWTCRGQALPLPFRLSFSFFWKRRGGGGSHRVPAAPILQSPDPSHPTPQPPGSEAGAILTSWHCWSPSNPSPFQRGSDDTSRPGPKPQVTCLPLQPKRECHRGGRSQSPGKGLEGKLQPPETQVSSLSDCPRASQGSRRFCCSSRGMPR